MKHSPEELKKVTVQEKINWRSFANRDGIAKQWNAPATPTYYMIDHEGTIRHKWVGAPGAKTIDKALTKLIEKARTP